MLKLMGRVRLLMTGAAGALALAGVAAGPARAEWLKAESEHFVIYGDTSRGEITRYAQKLERFDAVLRAYFPIPTEYETPRLDILLANGAADMNSIAPGISGGVAGFYAPDSGRIFAVVNTRSEMGDVVIFHEYAHHFMFQMTATAYPSWFVEGFAEYYGMSEIRPDRVKIARVSQGRMNTLVMGANRWAPMEDVLRWRVSAAGRYRAFDYYAQSWALTHYMLATPERTAKLGQYLGLVKTGADPVVALNTAFALTPEQLQEELRRYLRGAVNELTPQIQLPEAEVTVSALPASYDRLIWYDFRLDRDPFKPGEPTENATQEQRQALERRNREGAQEQRDLIRDAQADAGRFAGDRMATLVKARAQRLDGKPADALDTLSPLLTGPTEDAIALRLAGECLLEISKTEADATAKAAMQRQTRTYLARAVEANPLDFRTYLALDDSRQGAAGYPNANDLSTLEVAVALAPQSSDTRVRAARVYMAQNQPVMAVSMLTPVANNPHGGSGLGPIRALLARARAAAGMTPAAEGDAPAPSDEDEGEGAGE